MDPSWDPQDPQVEHLHSILPGLCSASERRVFFFIKKKRGRGTELLKGTRGTKVTRRVGEQNIDSYRLINWRCILVMF